MHCTLCCNDIYLYSTSIFGYFLHLTFALFLAFLPIFINMESIKKKKKDRKWKQEMLQARHELHPHLPLGHSSDAM